MSIAEHTPEFDTLAYAQRLKAAGIEEKHAEAARDSQAGLATKAALEAGLDNLEARLNAKLNALRAELRGDMERAVNRILLAIMALNAILFAAMKFL